MDLCMENIRFLIARDTAKLIKLLAEKPLSSSPGPGPGNLIGNNARRFRSKL